MKLNALLVDPALLGDEGWEYLDRIASVLPDLGLVVCTGRSTVAQRVRGLRLGVDDWIDQAVPSRRRRSPGSKRSTRRRRRGSREFEAAPIAAGELEIRPDRFQAFVGDGSPRPHPPRVRAAPPARRGARPGARARDDLPAGLGLRDGPRRSLGRRLHPQAAPEAGEALAELVLHPHPLRDRLPASTPNRPASSRRSCGPPPRRRSTPPRRRRLHRSFTRPSRRGNRRPGLPAMLGEHGDGNREQHSHSRPGACRSAPRSTPPWSTAGR